MLSELGIGKRNTDYIKQEYKSDFISKIVIAKRYSWKEGGIIITGELSVFTDEFKTL